MRISKKALIITLAMCLTQALGARDYRLSNGKMAVSVNGDGRLTELRNLSTGTDYAGGGALWRLYYDTPDRRENEIDGASFTPEVFSDGKSIVLKYHVEKVDFGLTLTVTLDDDKVRFGSKLENNEPHTIIRELQYPLVGDLRLPDGYKLLTTHGGGTLYDDVKRLIVREGIKNPYMTPAQKYRQMALEYPRGAVAANCFALVSEKEGLYFGSHDSTFVSTGHGLRVYPSASEKFDRLECGFYKYPNCLFGRSWECNANVIAPYSGDWTVTSRLYRAWADASWWDRHEPPQWVRTMKSWQRIIFRHQYGEQFFSYKDLPGRIADVEKSVDSDATLIFGWWKRGMDNGNPDYEPDPAQGGADGLRDAISAYQAGGGHAALYVNGKLIDRESDFYLSGQANGLTMRDNTGSEYVENYKFTGMGSFLGTYNYRSFAVADTRNPHWVELMKGWADMALDLGASSVFYDQMGAVERSAVPWDLSGEFPVPDLSQLTAKGGAMKDCRDHAHEIGLAVGSEHITDYLSMYVDYTHGDGLLDFLDWFRYTFPELIISDRCIRDDTDIERRVNLTVLKGLRNDIEIYRCRGLIDETPHYQAYLAKINALKEKYSDLLLEGRFAYKDFFSCSNSAVEARCFVNGNRLAIVATSEADARKTARMDAPGYHFVEASTIGDATVSSSGKRLRLGQHGLAVLVFEK